MSHALGKVRFEDGEVLYYEFDGTVSYVCTALRRTTAEVEEHWRADNCAACTCGKPPEVVRIETSYGGGSVWDGTACRTCMAITEGFRPDWAVDDFPWA